MQTCGYIYRDTYIRICSLTLCTFTYLGNLGVGNYQRYFETSIIEHIKRLFSHMVGDYRTCSLVNGFLRASSRFPIACFPRRPHHHSTKVQNTLQKWQKMGYTLYVVKLQNAENRLRYKCKFAEYAAEVTKRMIYTLCSLTPKCWK